MRFRSDYGFTRVAVVGIFYFFYFLNDCSPQLWFNNIDLQLPKDIIPIPIIPILCVTVKISFLHDIFSHFKSHHLLDIIRV